MEKSVLLMLLFLSGLSILPSCLSFHYKYVNESKNWFEAQSYCRENYTDLATFYDNATLPDQTDDAWIGLYKGIWTWSLNGEVLPFNKTSCGSHYASWFSTEIQTQYTNDVLCVYMKELGTEAKWNTGECSDNKYFVCYDGRNNTHQYICITEKKTWNESQSYCRANHTDLASVRNAAEKNLIQNLCLSNCNGDVWIGLSISKNWQWSDQSVSSFKNWNPGEPNGIDNAADNQINQMCVERYFQNDASKKMTRAFWNDVQCVETYNKHFFCYDDDLVLVHENKTWMEALNHCRQQGWDLVSIHSERIQHWVQRRARKATTPYVWLGLRFTCALRVWFWVSEHALCHQNWAQGHGGSSEECQKAGAMPREGPQQWEGMHQTEKLNFICTKTPDDY